jgi:hypothetical protein
MNLEQAKAIIEDALNLAMQKGCYSLTDAKLIVEALQVNNSSVSFEIQEPVSVNQSVEKK